MDFTIEARGLTKRYGDLVAVDGIDLQIPRGAFFGILGPNGAGKTTLLEMIEGLRPHDAGTVTVAGEHPWPRNPRLLGLIGVQLQASSFFEHLTVREQILTFADLYGAPHSRAMELLDQMGLTEKVKERTEKLSGGQKQRLSIACSLVHNPEIVFLDEPTSALDPQARRNLWDILRGLHDDGRTIVLTTHAMDEAEALCEQVAVIDRGRILTVDSPAALIAAHGVATLEDVFLQITGREYRA